MAILTVIPPRLWTTWPNLLRDSWRLYRGYLLAQTSRDVTPMASAIDMAIAHLSLLGRVTDGAS
jgi:hypothetical protein